MGKSSWLRKENMPRKVLDIFMKEGSYDHKVVMKHEFGQGRRELNVRSGTNDSGGDVEQISRIPERYK